MLSTLEENLENNAREIKQKLELPKDISFIFTGSEILGYSDKKSDIDAIGVTNEELEPKKYYFRLESGQLIDLALFNREILEEKLASEDITSHLKDKLLFSASMLSEHDNETMGLLDKVTLYSITYFLEFLDSQSKRQKDKPIEFCIDSLVHFPQIIKILHDPEHRHRVARRMKSPRYEKAINSQKRKYLLNLRKLVNEELLKETPGGSFLYSQNNSQGLTSFYSTVLTSYMKKFIGAGKRAIITKGDETTVSAKKDVFDKLRKALLFTFEYMHNLKLVSGGLVDFIDDGDHYKFSTQDLSKITSQSQSYKIIRNLYRKIREKNYHDLNQQITRSKNNILITNII